jgi:alkanesulfonate monooxygenase SsuD/methylene tetrahydromethanopterin reductase-like flavin-dependent oxidoreductase (luciferase family)
MAALLPCSVAAPRQEAFDALRPVLAFYVGFFPRYHRLLVAQGFPEAAQAIRTAWNQGNQAGAACAVPDALIAAVAVAGTSTECHERIEAYRRAGITLPIIFPVVRGAGPAGKQDVLDALHACAP